MRLAYVPLLLLAACVPKVGATDSAGETDTTTGASAGTSAGSSAGTTAVTGSPVNVCEALPWHGCLPVGDCEANPCGEPGAAYDADGCLRGGCGGDEDCYDGEVCYRPLDWGGCASSGTYCEWGQAMECQCGGTDDCGGAYCVVAGTVPDPACREQTEEGPCLDLGCNEFVTAEAVVLGPMGCECTGAIGTCLYLPEGVTGEPAVTAYYRELDPDDVRLFPNVYTVPPVGWAQCFDNPGEPAACACLACP